MSLEGEALRIYRVPQQVVKVGPLAEAVGSHELKPPVMVLGTPQGIERFEGLGILSESLLSPTAAPHNPIASIDRAVSSAVANDIQTVVAFGGGSAIDLGKAVVRSCGANLVAVPTTLSGAEMTRVFGARTPDGTKTGGAGSGLLPSAVFYDPALLSTLPLGGIIATGVNALAHALEATYGRSEHWLGRASARMAGSALPALLARSTAGDQSLQRSRDLLAAACQAGFALNACGMGLHHAICHVLGGLTGVSHSLLNVSVLPAAVETNRLLAPDPVEKVLDDFSLSDLGTQVGQWARSADIPSDLKALGVTREDINVSISRIMAEHHLSNNPAVVDEKDVLRTLNAAYDGSAQ